MNGVVFDIQRGALNDGPGIRTTVFLKGCPLRCRWCHNPESWSLQPQTALPARPGYPPVRYGYTASVEEVLREVRRDRVYYEVSGGGMTISGGEPAMQPAFCLGLLRAAHGEGIHTCLDTCGFFDPALLRDFLPCVDLFLWDYKATGPGLHKELTGVDPGRIQENFEAAYGSGASILLRCPLVPGVNDQPEHLEEIARRALEYPNLRGIEVLPYHSMGADKYGRLGLPLPSCPGEMPDETLKERWRRFFRDRAVEGKVTVL